MAGMRTTDLSVRVPVRKKVSKSLLHKTNVNAIKKHNREPDKLKKTMVNKRTF